VLGWFLRELSAPFLFLNALLRPAIRWKAGVYRLKWGGVVEEINPTVKLWQVFRMTYAIYIASDNKQGTMKILFFSVLISLITKIVVQKVMRHHFALISELWQWVRVMTLRDQIAYMQFVKDKESINFKRESSITWNICLYIVGDFHFYLFCYTSICSVKVWLRFIRSRSRDLRVFGSYYFILLFLFLKAYVRFNFLFSYMANFKLN
jgi:hypothetical protein